MTHNSPAGWPCPSWLDGDAHVCDDAAGDLLSLASGPEEPREGILRFPVRWDAVSKASHLKAVTGLPWGVEYHADSRQFRVVLGEDSIRYLKAADSADGDGSAVPTVGLHRFDSA